MDSGWAAIIGASIGLLGSTLAGVVTPMITRRRETLTADRKTLLQQRATAIREFIRACSATVEEIDRNGRNELFTAREVALVDLALLLRSDERSVLRVAELAIGAVSQLDTRRGVAAMVEISTLLPAWHRGELTPEEVLKQYEVAMQSEEDAIAREEEATADPDTAP